MNLHISVLSAASETHRVVPSGSSQRHHGPRIVELAAVIRSTEEGHQLTLPKEFVPADSSTALTMRHERTRLPPPGEPCIPSLDCSASGRLPLRPSWQKAPICSKSIYISARNKAYICSLSLDKSVLMPFIHLHECEWATLWRSRRHRRRPVVLGPAHVISIWI